MKRKSWIIPGLAIVFIGLLLLVLRPVPIPLEKDCLTTRGIVSEVYEAGTNDVVFKLHDLNQTFYVNRGLERGLELEKLRAELVSKEITIKYPKYWTPLDPVNSSRHISKVEHEERIIFSEIEPE
ncbi:MAG TPA: hypothetical protein VK616_16390 [Flavitalea sp.]|nr:hypothetical protein [Flavitalea sp.]HTF32050.1 hypothetical protein [Flavitalea sp.]